MGTLPEELTPHFLDFLKAKSKDKGGQTLAEHTWDVVSRLADLARLRPTLGNAHYWQCKFDACFLHDFGKAAQGFQDRLLDKPIESEWSIGKHRHEVLSLAFVDWLYPVGKADRIHVIATIATHHKDAKEIWAKYGVVERDQEQIRRIAYLCEQINAETSELLFRWMAEVREPWYKELGFPAAANKATPHFKKITAAAISLALDELSDYHLRYEEYPPDNSNLVADLLHRGLILTADHAASGGAGRFPDMPLTMEMAQKPLKNFALRDHQRMAVEVVKGSTILVAPTGSGKTEAALMWAARQMQLQPAARLFYTLPYQASMNAMYERLATRFLGYSKHAVDNLQCEVVTIQHSRALLKLYQDAMALDEMAPKQAEAAAKRLRNLAGLNAFPIQVFSPYQMLKAAYSLKGYEPLLLDYAQGLFIFDEIHAYEPKRLALIIELMRWLRLNLAARFLVMTATLPPPVFEQLKAALGVTEASVIYATDEEFKRSQRHVVHLLDGRLSSTIVEKVKTHRANGESVLVCLNRVADAQRVYKLLKARLGLVPTAEIILLHGRFNGKDRQAKERVLLETVGVDSDRSRRRAMIVVATQVVEVSLNVDFDTIYSDPAPLEAMLQRFGRVNRGRKRSTLCPVYVFRQPDSPGKKPFMPYAEAMVRQSLEVLEECAGKAIDESQVTEMLRRIYSGAILEEWEKEYRASAASFQGDILGKMIPFQSAQKEDAQKFYELFDGVEVLPTDCEQAYANMTEEKRFLDARKFLVNISYAQYVEFYKYGRIIQASKLDGAFADQISVDYDDEFGLRLDEARQAEKQAKEMDDDD